MLSSHNKLQIVVGCIWFGKWDGPLSKAVLHPIVLQFPNAFRETSCLLSLIHRSTRSSHWVGSGLRSGIFVTMWIRSLGFWIATFKRLPRLAAAPTTVKAFATRYKGHDPLYKRHDHPSGSTACTYGFPCLSPLSRVHRPTLTFGSAIRSVIIWPWDDSPMFRWAISVSSISLQMLSMCRHSAHCSTRSVPPSVKLKEAVPVRSYY